MEPESSLSYSQVPATCPYPEPTPSSLHPPPTSWRSILILSSHLRLGLPNGLFPSGFPTRTLCTPHVAISSHENSGVLNIFFYYRRLLKMDLNEVGWEGVEWIRMVQNRS